MSMSDWPARHGRHFHRRRVLVTGGAGFIGSHLAQALLTLGAEVVILDDLSGGSLANVEAAAEAANREPRFIEGSIRDARSLKRAITGCQYVFHQAALGSAPASVADPARYHAVNTTGTAQVLDAARQGGVARFIFAASSAAYGDADALPEVETMPTRPQSPYAATKIAGEAMAHAYAASYTMDTVSLRYFNIFGPRQNANTAYAAVIAAFADTLLNETPAVIHGDGEQSRDFTYVDNAVEANLLAARSTRPLAGAALNVGYGRRVTINALLKQMADLAGCPAEPRYDAPRAGDVRHSAADLSRIVAALGYEPIVDLETGLEQTLAWYQQGLAPAATPAPVPRV